MSVDVMTVTGPVRAASLGITLPHEHLFTDIRNQFTTPSDPAARRLGDEPVRMSNLGALRRNPYAVRDNLVIGDDFETTVRELMFFKDAGGQTLVDCTPSSIAGDPIRLREVSLATGLNIIAGTAFYTHDTHPPWLKDAEAEALAEILVRELEVGIGDTDIRAGLIGELGTSSPIHPEEEKVLLAASLAFAQRPVPIQVHTYPWGKEGTRAADILLKAGVAPHKIVIDHLDVELDHDYMLAVLDRGLYLEFDDFGKQYDIDPGARGGFAKGRFARDDERVESILRLLDAGFGQRLLITNDICFKTMLRAYGGWGYDHILTNIVPMLEDAGVGKQAIEDLLIHNPRRLFDAA